MAFYREMPVEDMGEPLMAGDLRKSTCPECGGQDLIRDYEAGELVCQSCGFVVSTELLDHGPEWRAFDIEQRERRARAGAPLTLTMHDRGLSTTTDWSTRDGQGQALKPEARAKMNRLRKWQRRSKVSGPTERNLSYALSEMTNVGAKLNLPGNVLETASMVYRKAIRKNIVKGRSIRAVVSASIYMATRKCKVVRTLDDVAKAANLERKELSRTYRFMLRSLKTEVPRSNPHSHLSVFISQLGLSGATELMAKEIIDQASSTGLTSGRGPVGIAAASVYVAGQLTGESRTQGEIARSMNVTEVTIRNRYKELVKKLSIEIKM